MCRGAVWLLLVLGIGCTHSPVSERSAAATFEQIEARLLSAKVLRIDYEIEARGAVTANLTGDLVIQQPARAAIRAEGDFVGAEVVPLLVSDGRRMRGGTTKYFDGVVPDDLRNGLLLGLTRMGVLHNLAMLSQDAPPDATDGSVRDWVMPRNFSNVVNSRTVDGVPVKGVRFEIDVGGAPAGEVLLWYSPETGLPIAREQLVKFDHGDMRVIERYKIEIDGIIGPCRFATASLAVDQ